MWSASRVLVVFILAGLVACGGTSVVTTADGGDDGGSLNDAGADADASSPTCSPGASVFCRCANRDEGTKQCASDGRSFGPCATGAGVCAP